jgi:hypothetical protein
MLHKDMILWTEANIPMVLLLYYLDIIQGEETKEMLDKDIILWTETNDPMNLHLS